MTTKISSGIEIRIFPGSKSDYESLVGYSTEIVRRNRINDGATIITYETFRESVMLENLHPRRSTANLKELGIEAIVNAQRNVIHRTQAIMYTITKQLWNIMGFQLERKNKKKREVLKYFCP